MINKKKFRSFDQKTFFAALLFFFVVLINPRDFPVKNLPLIYPTFILYALIIGPYHIVEGFKRTLFLTLILFIYWGYFSGLYVVKGNTLTPGRFAYLIEPILIFIASGAATSRAGGSRAAIWALVSAITLSTAAGLWIYFIGEPVATWRSILHRSTGGTLLSGEFIREIDLKTDLAAIVIRNTGLSYYIFLFSYQLAVALLIVLVSLFSGKYLKINNRKRILLMGALLILLLGMITNTERATIFSVLCGLLFFFWIRNVKIFNLQTIVMFIICFSIVLASFKIASDELEAKYTLMKRSYTKEKILVRAYMWIPAIVSITYNPLGAGGMSKYYEDVAYQLGWLASYGPKAPHNQFANVIMYTGIIGVVLVILLFKNLWQKIKNIRSTADIYVHILAASLIGCIMHSFTHNGGFFSYEPATEIVFGLFWGATSLKANKSIP